MDTATTSIVLIEDDEDDYLLTRDMLDDIQRGRFDLRWVSSYDEAVSVLHAGHADVYLVDYRLGQRNGLELLSEALSQGVRAPIIILTGQGSSEIDIQAMEAGAADYLVKGEINSFLLERTIRYAIERRQAAEQLKRRYEQLQTINAITAAVSRAEGIEDIYQIALDGLRQTLNANRASIQLIDGDGQLRFKAWYLLSDSFRAAVEGYSPWSPSDVVPVPVLVPEAMTDPMMAGLRVALKAEGLRSVAFFPLTRQQQLVGQFSLYYTAPHVVEVDEVDVAQTLASSIAFALERQRAAEKLTQERGRLAALVDTAIDAIITLNKDQSIVQFNPAAEQIFHCRAANVLGQPVDVLIPLDTGTAHRQHIQDFSESGVAGRPMGEIHSANLATNGRRSDGEIFPIEASVVQFDVDSQRFYTVILRDITERKKAEAALREAEERYRTLVEQIPVVVYRAKVDSVGSSLYVSPAITDLLGFTPDEWLADPSLWFKQLHPDDRPWVETALQSHFQSRQAVDVEYRLLSRDGRVVWVRDTARIVEMGAGQPPQQHGVMADITESKRAAAIEREQRTLIEALLDTAESLNGTLDLEEVLDRILDNVERVAPSDAASIVLIDGDQAYVARWRGYAKHNLAGVMDNLRWPLAQTPDFQRMLATGQPQIHDDVQLSPEWADLQGLRWQRAVIGVPIRSQGEIIGFLNLESAEAGVYSTRHGDDLRAFADQASVAVQNSRLYDRVRRHAARAEALAGAAARLNTDLDLQSVLRTICEETSTALQLDAAGVFLYDERRSVFRLAEIVGLPERYKVLHQPIPRGNYDQHLPSVAETLVLPDLQALPDLINGGLHKDFDLRTLLSAPMQRDDRRIGVVIGLTVHAVRHFAADEIALLQALAAQATQAIVNAQMFAETRQRMERLHALHAIDGTIAASVDLTLTLSVLLEQVIMQLQVDAADVLIADPHSLVLSYAAGRGLASLALQKYRTAIGREHAGRAALERVTVTVPVLASDAAGEPRSQLLARERFVTYYGVPLVAKGQAVGVLEVFSRRPLEAVQEWLDFLETLAGQAAIAIDSGRLFAGLQRSNFELALAYDATIEGWSRALDLRDKETEGHTRRVTELSMTLATRMGLPSNQLVDLRRGALLHDIGKMGVPDNILLKPGRLTDDEWQIMKLHPVYAFEMLSPIDYLQGALDIPYCHHEKWDGSGYPRGLKREQIPLAARIFAVVDVWDALRSDRPYRPAWSEDRVRSHIASLSGSHFDPAVVDAFLAMI